ncbi:MAG TPA: toll/interleukin-1 receptor domain-containing protein [Vicinamibacterales bacterium]|nr:toll/interleukin-1 receptor domain-containing protein [Vicinamibacterales bacterium]
MPRIFISYRREDTAGYAGRVYDGLQRRFGPENVFMDVDSLRPGDDFVEAIGRTLDQCDVMLAIIGPRWLAVTDKQGTPRLFDEGDFVRIEIQSALEKRLRTVPILVGRASVPRRQPNIDSDSRRT